MRKLTGIVAAVLFGVIAAGCNSNSGSSNPGTPGTANPGSGGGGADTANKTAVNIVWAQWKPSDYLGETAAEFTKETGIPVKVTQIAWPQYQDKIYTDVFTAHSSDYDLIVGDSQWLGLGATKGHYEDLTDWSNTNVPWSEISPNARTFYCDYNKKTYAVPCESDAIGFAYRKDWFTDPKEMANFKAKYKYDLAPPTTWAQFRDISEFFTRPTEKRYGCALFYAGGGAYDGVTMGFDQVLWCLGGQLADPKTGVVQGVVNNKTGVDALKFYAQDLKAFCPPGCENFYYDQTLTAFKAGQVAMAEDWYTFFPGLASADANPQFANTAYFVSPGGIGGHFISLGGQGLSLSSYSKNKDNAKKFLAWFSSKAGQTEWAKHGGLTSDIEVLKTDEFKNAAPFSNAFAESAPLMKDFYNNPDYAKLLEATQIHWNEAVTGQETPQQAMDAVAATHTTILKAGGYIK